MVTSNSIIKNNFFSIEKFIKVPRMGCNGILKERSVQRTCYTSSLLQVFKKLFTERFFDLRIKIRIRNLKKGLKARGSSFFGEVIDQFISWNTFMHWKPEQ